MIWWLKKQLLRIQLYVTENYQNEAESLVIWYAICYALGVAFYLTIPYELPIWMVVGLLEIILLALFLNQQRAGLFKLLTYMAVFIIGLCIAKADALYRQNNLELNLDKTVYINGTVEDITYSSTNHARLVLNLVNNFERDLKGKFKITTNQNHDWLKVGSCVELVADFPPSYQENPLGDYNFARADFYQGISRTGYTVSPIFKKDCEEKLSSAKSKTNMIRENIKQLIDTHTTPAQSAIIKALTIGDKNGVSTQQYQDYRRAGIAHILAISGMHMGMIALLAFLLIRLLLLPFGQGRYDLRKPAAVTALLVGLMYFLISGQSVSCVRAFIMTSLILLAVLLNRRPISLRLWAFALIVVICFNPSAVVSAGFLMSFAATLGLISFYEKNASALKKWYVSQSVLGKFAAYFFGIILTDLIASLMTLPYSLYYFHQFSVYTTLGNLLAGPIVAFWIMPAILLFFISIPLGLSSYFLKFLTQGIDILNNIAVWVSSLRGAGIGESVGQMPSGSILLITLGLLWLCIWQQRWRYLGGVVIILGFAGFYLLPQADFVFDAGGKTYACRTADGKLSPTPWHKNKFFINTWLGHPFEDIKDYNKAGLTCDNKKCICQNRIEFKRGYVIFDGKEINLDNAGYINLNKGITLYTKNKPLRLWDKQ